MTSSVDVACLQAHVATERDRNEELQQELQTLTDDLETERLLASRLHGDLKKEKRLVNELLDKMEEFELEARKHAQDAKNKEADMQKEIASLKASLDEERSMRLQHMFMISRTQMDKAVAAKEAKTMQQAMHLSREETNRIIGQLEAVQTALRQSQRSQSAMNQDLVAATLTNHENKMEGHSLRQRLVEAEEDARTWRSKYMRLSSHLESKKAEEMANHKLATKSTCRDSRRRCVLGAKPLRSLPPSHTHRQKTHRGGAHDSSADLVRRGRRELAPHRSDMRQSTEVSHLWPPRPQRLSKSSDGTMDFG